MRGSFLDFGWYFHAGVEPDLVGDINRPGRWFDAAQILITRILSTAFKQLSKKIRACRVCESSLPLGANPVFQAAPEASVLVAGQAPGIRVHNTGIPFNDPSGDRLRQWMGVDRELFYSANKIALVPMGFCYPGTGKSGDLPPRRECAQTWHQSLLAALPNVVLAIAIGQYAHRYYLQATRKSTLTETVRNWQNYGPDIIPLPHPSPRNNIWLKKNPWFEIEVIPVLQERVAAALNFPG